jgi:hypothetical protein
VSLPGPADDGERTYGAELRELTDALVELHSQPMSLPEADLDHVAAFRNMVLEAVTDLVALALGGTARRSLSSVDDLHIAPTAFLSRALRDYPRLLVEPSVSPADSFRAAELSPSARSWQKAARHALTATHIACSQTRLPTLPGERTPVVADLAAIAQASTGLDVQLAGAFERAADARADVLTRASRAPIGLVCREVRRQYDSASNDRSWDEVVLPRDLRPLVVSATSDIRRATLRLVRLIEATSGGLDVRGIAAIVQAQARTHFRLHELLAAHVQPARGLEHRDVVGQSVAHLEMAHLLADAYRSTARVASPFRGDRRPVTQAAELYRAISALPLARPPGPDVLVELAQPQLKVVAALSDSVGTGLSRGRLLVPGWDGHSGGTAWTLEGRAGGVAPLRRHLEGIHERSWGAFQAVVEPATATTTTAQVRHRLAALAQ